MDSGSLRDPGSFSIWASIIPRAGAGNKVCPHCNEMCTSFTGQSKSPTVRSHITGEDSPAAFPRGGDPCTDPTVIQPPQGHRVLCTPTRTWAPQAQRPFLINLGISSMHTVLRTEFLVNEWMNWYMDLIFRTCWLFLNEGSREVWLYSFTQFSFKIFWASKG